MAKRRSSSGFKFRTTAPEENTAILSIIVFIVAIIGWLASVSFLAPYTVLLLVVAYVVLLAGVLFKNL